MEGLSKKIGIRTFISIYAISFILNSTFFVNRNVSAAGGNGLTKIVAVIVDKDIYPSIQSDVQRYAQTYIQSKEANTKAVVFPVNIQTISAFDISKMLENMYFDGIQSDSSKLQGVVIIGNIPLPVIQDNGYMYPSIYPYVDFENQEFIFDSNKNFFVPNNNPNGQAEIRHGIINFDTTAQYDNYFAKLKNYNSDPASFVASKIWYDDFIGLKKYYVSENTNYYINKNIFSEDIGYHRLDNLLLDTLKSQHNDSILSVGSTLATDVSGSNSADLTAYAQMIQGRQTAAQTSMNQSGSKTPTLVLSKTIDELTKTYDGLISTKLLTQTRNNVEAAARWYKQDASGQWIDDISSHYEKIIQQDNRLLGDMSSNLQPLLIQFNNVLESGLNQEITAQKYAMKYPLPLTYQDIEYEAVAFAKKKLYTNFYFGSGAATITNTKDMSIFRGTFQNLSDLTGVAVANTEKSVDGSYHILSQQVEANRGYNLMNMTKELALRSGTRQFLLQKKKCDGNARIAGLALTFPALFFLNGKFLPGTDLCIGDETRDTTRGTGHSFTDIYGKTSGQGDPGGKELPIDFAVRNWGGASPINLDQTGLQNTNTYSLVVYDYRDAILPIYDIAGSQKISSAQSAAQSYNALSTYGSMIKTEDQAGPAIYPRAVAKENSFIGTSAGKDQAINIGGVPFVPKDLETYGDVNFFSIYHTPDSNRTDVPGSVILLKRESGPNAAGNKDSKTYLYKLIDTTQQNISPTPDEINNMNITTADRPIDSVRNITFQGIGGGVVAFTYPDLYQVPVYNTVGNTLVLMTPAQILTSLKTYLQSKVAEYNAQLSAQQSNETAYYTANAAAFNFLASSDIQATPNRSYTLLPADYLINQLVNSLDNLASLFGNKYIYGKTTPGTADEKLMLIANLLYQANNARPQKMKETNVNDDIGQAQASFNVNQKIAEAANSYLQSDNDSGAFLTPTYNQSGYEVAYINSDGADLVQTSDTPAFITQIQNVQSQKKEAETVANNITQQAQQSSFENQIDTECNVNADGSALIFDLHTMKSPWFDAMKCRFKNIVKQPFKITVGFDEALGPTFAGTLTELSGSLTTFGNQRKDFGASATQSDDTQNTNILSTASQTAQTKLKEVKDFVEVKAPETSRFVTSTGTHEITISTARDIGSNQVRMSATGDNCPGIGDGTTIFVQNLCQNTYTFNLTDTRTLQLIPRTTTAGESVVTTKICLGNSSTCIQKSQTFEVLPGPVENIQINKGTSILMAGAQMPITVMAQDASDNAISQVIEQYTITAQTGTINGLSSMTFNNFAQANFIYQAPENVSDNMPVTMTITGINQDGKLISGTQSVIVAKGILNVNYLNQIIYSTNAPASRAMGFTLPNASDGFVKSDADNIAQVQYNNIPSVSLILQDKNGNKLDSVLNITSKNGILTPGTIQPSTLDISGVNKTQYVFHAQNDFLIKDGRLDITLYPTTKAGSEELDISVPGLQPIALRFNVHPAAAQKVVLTLNKSTLSMDSGNNTTQATLQVVDRRNNLTDQTASIKLGVIGPGKINNHDLLTLPWTGAITNLTLSSSDIGGKGYLFGYIDGVQLADQVPGYQEFFVQNDVLPTTGLNVMYLNLFGTDRGNQRGYFSDNDKKVNLLTENSKKLLATTTQLVDPTKIKQIQATIDPNGEVNNLTDNASELRIESGKVINQITNIGTVALGNISEYTIKTVATTGDIQSRTKDATTILYLPAPTDSIITGNTISNKKLLINGGEVIDFQNGITDPGIQIISNTQQINSLTIYDITLNGTKIGNLALYKNTNLITDANVTLQDVVKYAEEKTFTDGSTNGPMGVGIYDTQSVYSKNGYQSIEDSSDPLLGIGFTSKFKNISYFAEGESVGQATLPYGSVFLINFGDPLVTRVSDNIKLSSTNLDGGMGQNIFTNPDKTIFKTIPADFNNDGLMDLLVAYTDGSIQLLKNYGGTNAYKDMQDLMILAVSIKDIQVGDVNDDKFPDIIVQTNDDKILVYRNRQGVIDVDGTPVCLNTNVEPGEITATPNDLSHVNQLFIQDMDKDGNVDIVTSDLLGDIKIFYGGSDGHGNGNYLSTQTGACDDGRYAREQGNYQVVKRLGLKIRSDRYVTDGSLIHRKNMQTPSDSTGDTEEVASFDADTPATNANGSDFSKDDALNAAQDLATNNDSYTTIAAKDLEYVSNPTSKVPAYESSMTADQVMFLPISKLSSGDAVSIYKQYTDLNGGTLKNNDQVQITTTILSLKYGNKLTYLDMLKGPWKIQKDTDNNISGLIITGTNANSVLMDPPDYQLMLDNILLNSGESMKISYIVTYQQPALTKINVQDEDLSDQGKPLDTYPDIAIQTSDSCLKTRWILRNNHQASQGYKKYIDVIDDIQQAIDDIVSGAKNDQQTQINSTFQQINNATDVSSTPGLSSFMENRSLKDLFTNGGVNLNLNTNFIDSATAGVSKKIDDGLNGLCQGFTMGKSCSSGSPAQGVMGALSAFNQAFLAPGDYHLLGCVPTAPNPLAPLFTALNKSLGKGLPILSFPTASPVFVRPLSAPAGAGGIFGGTTSQFRLYIAPTLTLGLGFAICFGPYGVAVKIPKPFRDLGGNCIVFAIPHRSKTNSCNTDTSSSIGTDVTDPSVVNGADNGTCSNPPVVGNTVTFASTNNTVSTNTDGTSSPFQAVEIQGSVNNPLVPAGNFGGLIQIDQDPIIVTNPPASTVEGQITQTPGYDLKAGPAIDLKVVGAKTKGLVKCIIDNRFTKQIQYIINNLTHMTIQVDLPDVTQLTQGVDKITGLSKDYQQITAEERAGGNIGTTTGALLSQNGVLSQQRFRNQSELYGQNPFEAIAKMFKDVPLINISTKDINVKVPMLTSEDVNTYMSYLKSRKKQNQQILDQRQSFFDEIIPFCTSSGMQQEIKDYPANKAQLAVLQQQKNADLTTMSDLSDKVKHVETCMKLNSQDNFQKFIAFKENSAQLIRSVDENIKVLDQYKQFPSQLYEWVHVSDRYFAELSSVTSDFVKNISFRISTNANRFSKYVDAITLIIGAIKTWQAIIDFSVNRSEKCSKCSNDNYGSFSCSLSFLCPQLPIFKIPPFKIPDIHIDLSHLELGVDILLPKFNFVPIKIPLPQLPKLPEPPSIQINRDVLYKINLKLFENMTMPTVPVLPSPPQLPELPSFIPDVKLQLPVLPPAPQIPKILPEINGTLKVADFIGKVFCIVKGGIGLVGEKGVKAKIEQITQRTWNVPIFDYFDLTTNFKQPPLEGFEYQVDAYVRLKYNFEGVYTVMDNLAQTANQVVSKTIIAPILSGANLLISGTKAVQQVVTSGTQQLPTNININGYLPSSGDMDYATAYHTLSAGLLTFQKAAAQDKELLSKIDDIYRTINADRTVTPATKELDQAKAQADGIIAQKQSEVDQIEKNILDYDTFINDLSKQQIQLVKKDDFSATISAPLIKGNPTTEDMISKQEDPTKTYLALNEGLIQGYSKALDNSTPEGLNMTDDTYQKSQKLLTSLKQKIDTAQTVQQDGSTDKVLLASSSSCPTCVGSADPQDGYQQDISAYAQGIFIQTGSGTGKGMINVVNNTSLATDIAKNYVIQDMNNDHQNDILMWDANNIYLKYANQKSEELSQGGNHLTRFYTRYYIYQNNSSKRWIDNMQDLINNTTKGYLTLQDSTLLKVCDQNQEVKNFETQGQTFDTLQLGWKNSISLGDNVDGYIIKFTHKIDNFFDRVQTYSFFGNLTTDTSYILVLPNGTTYDTGILRVENVNKKITSLMTGTILAVKYFDPAQGDISLNINELPRKRAYAQIAALQQKTNIFTTSSPWSNQIVAGNQILGDALPPVAQITLHRIQTNEDVGTGNTLQGYINTTYALNVARTDNVTVTKMNIEKDGQLIGVKTGTASTGSMIIAPLFFTGATGQTYTFSAVDANGNVGREVVNLDIAVPKITIDSVNQLDKNTAEVIASIEHDLDEGLVTFQRTRNNMVHDITGTNSNSLGGYALSPKQTIITGGVFTFGNTIGLYSPSGDEIGTIDPQYGEIKIDDAWKNKILLKLDFVFHIPTIKVVDTTTNKELFQITYPAQKLGTIKLLQGKPDYESVALTQPQFQEFNGGTCIKNASSECVLYINNQGTIYAPGVYTSMLGGTYSFDSTTNTVIYTITDETNQPIASVSVLIQPLIQ